MLRMLLVGLLIPLGVGILAAMELRTPPPAAVAVVQPLAETTAGMSVSHDALAKADRLESTSAKNATPAQSALVDERPSPSKGATIGSSEVPKISRRHDPKPRKVATAALRKSKPKTTDVKRASIAERR